MNHGIYDVTLGGGQASIGQQLNPDGGVDSTRLALRLELVESLACWYELLLNPETKEARQIIIDQLRAMQAKVNATPMARQHGHSDFCMLSFLGTRTRTRFCTTRQPKFSMFGGDFVFFVEVGKNRQQKKLSTTFIDSRSGNAVRPEIFIDENFITISFSDEEQEKMSVYDFLRKCGLELQISTDIFSVEYNAYPVERWLEAADRKLTQMLYSCSNEDNDFFFYNNLFKLTLMQLDQHAYTVGGVPDFSGRVSTYAMTLQERGEIIEKAFNAYFNIPQPNLQLIQKADVIKSHPNLQVVQVLMEMNNPHEMYRFGSLEVEANDKHMFTCEVQGNNVWLSVLE